MLEFAAAELGARQGTTTGAGRSMLADALDLRHRLPQTWTRVCAGGSGVAGRKVAQATRHLSRDAAAQVDVAVAGLITALPWNRFESVLAAKIIEADPADAELRAELWEAERFVRTGRTGEGGLKLLVARAEAGDVIWFMATVNRIAEILRLEGSADTVDVRRAQAIGVLAQPARALELLFAHQGDQVRTDDPDLEPGPVREDEPTDDHQILLVADRR